MATTTKADGLLDLVDAAREVNQYLTQEDSYAVKSESFRVKAALMLAALRKRIDAGEAGNTGWEKWCGQNIKRSYRDVQKLLALVKDKDAVQAAKALAEQRKKARDGMHKVRAAKVSRPLADIKSAILKLSAAEQVELQRWLDVAIKRGAQPRQQHRAA